MPFIKIEVSDAVEENLMYYGEISNKSPEQLAANILETAMMHFQAGRVRGMDQAQEIMESKKCQIGNERGQGR